jgi:hypothetical protein
VKRHKVDTSETAQVEDAALVIERPSEPAKAAERAAVEAEQASTSVDAKEGADHEVEQPSTSVDPAGGADLVADQPSVTAEVEAVQILDETFQSGDCAAMSAVPPPLPRGLGSAGRAVTWQ